MTFKVGDKVEKVGGDYTFVGVVVAAFTKLSGAERYVVEDDRGVLHVYSAKTLKFQEGTLTVKDPYLLPGGAFGSANTFARNL